VKLRMNAQGEVCDGNFRARSLMYLKERLLNRTEISLLRTTYLELFKEHIILILEWWEWRAESTPNSKNMCLLKIDGVENSVLRKTVGPAREEGTGRWRKLHIEKRFRLHQVGFIIRSSIKAFEISVETFDSFHLSLWFSQLTLSLIHCYIL
jgi:hypothetical protein